MVRQGLQERQGHLVNQVHQDHLVPVVLPDNRVLLAQEEMWDHWGQPDRQDLLDNLVPLDLQEELDLLVHLDHVETLGRQDHQDHEEMSEHLEQKAT